MRTLRVLLIAGVISVLVTSNAGAHDAIYRTRLSASQAATNAYVGGEIASRANLCFKNRKVDLYHQTPTGAEFVGSDRSDNDGEWLVSFAAQSGEKYFAKAKRIVRMHDGQRHICRGARSNEYGP
jgi:hypothetical protein